MTDLQGAPEQRRATVRSALSRLPRVELAITPTPLQAARRLSAELGGPPIFIKRDDLTGLALGGNKVRMLEYVLGKAVDEGCDTVIGGSASQSNYSRVLAGSCAKLGLDCHLVLRRMKGRGDDSPQGSLLLDHLYGASVQLIDDDRHLQVDVLEALGDQLTASGHVVYRALQASEDDKAMHALPYVEAAFELIDQLDEMNVDAARIYICSLDTTHAGLLLGLRVAGSNIELVGVSPYEGGLWADRTAEEEVTRLANEAAAMLDIDVVTKPDEVRTTFKFAGRYGQVTDEGVAATHTFARTEGLIVDPIYTMKAAAAMITDIRHGDVPDGPIVFWHTGGIPALFAYSTELGVNDAEVPGRADAIEREQM
jgi:1-aminocyclopropane-1-carboxylate deaminase/D-cysteine desulfhydrase-like pyridoxal-dependent ACC family enzyme